MISVILATKRSDFIYPISAASRHVQEITRSPMEHAYKVENSSTILPRSFACLINNININNSNDNNDNDDDMMMMVIIMVMIIIIVIIIIMIMIMI